MIYTRVADIRDEAEGVKSFRLIADDGTALPNFTPGAHVDVHLGPNLVRQYSLCNGPEDRDHYLIAVKREPQSRGGSARLHAVIKTGDVLEISEPRNNFPLATNASEHVLLAGGIGITPLLSMAKHLEKDNAKYRLHYFTRSEQGTAFHAQLATAPYQRRTDLHVGLEPDELARRLPDVLGPATASRHVYLCGPAPFMDLVRRIAGDAGWATDHVHLEYFGAVPGAAPNAAFEVELAQSGETFAVGPDQTLLQALRAHGLTVESDCEQGTCGTCASMVVSGEINHRDQFLSDDQKEEGQIILPCVSRAKGRLVLDL